MNSKLFFIETHLSSQFDWELRGDTGLNITKQGLIVHRSGLNNENNINENKKIS